MRTMSMRSHQEGCWVGAGPSRRLRCEGTRDGFSPKGARRFLGPAKPIIISWNVVSRVPLYSVVLPYGKRDNSIQGENKG